MNKSIVIIDCGIGNLLSIKNSISYHGLDSVVTSDPSIIERSSHIILPGVGAFPSAMQKLKSLNLIEPLNLAKKKGKFILGICLGMQLLFSSSDEFENTKGLNLIDGNIVKLDQFEKAQNIKLPNIGWRELEEEANIKDISILKNIDKISQFYFVHSYALKNYNKEVKILNSSYQNIRFPAVVNFNNIFGCQFHPEKSREQGLKIIKNFLNL